MIGAAVNLQVGAQLTLIHVIKRNENVYMQVAHTSAPYIKSLIRLKDVIL